MWSSLSRSLALIALVLAPACIVWAQSADTVLMGQGAGVIPKYTGVPNCIYESYSTGSHAWSCGPTPTATPTPSFQNANLIQNGGMLYDRRHAQASVTLATGVGQFVGDRWNPVFTAAGSGAGSQAAKIQAVSSAVGNFVNSLLLTASSTPATSHPAGASFTVTQTIEGSDVSDLGFGTATAATITLTRWAKTSLANFTYTESLRNSAGNRSYVHDCVIVSANTWTQCSFTVTGDTTGTWLYTEGTIGIRYTFSVNGGSTFQTTPDTWQAGNFTATANTSDLTANASATFEYTGVKVERGNVATAYVEDPAPVALGKIGHYYQTSAPIGTAPADGIAAAGATCIENPIANGEAGVYLKFQPPLYASPTVVLYNPSVGAAGKWRNITAGADVTMAVDPATTKSTTGVEIAAAGTTTTIADEVCGHWSADTGR